jgi:Ni,Fe-hydrogenase maturation factor
VDLRDVLALAELRGTLPADTVAFGLQPASVEMRASLSETLRDGVPALVEQVVQELARRGHPAERFAAERAHA